MAFEKTVEENRDRTALIFDGPLLQRWTYAELNKAANKCSRLLLEKGIRRADIVGIAGQKCFESFVSLLACLKIGAPYVFFDLDSPIARLNKIFAQCKPKALLLVEGKEYAGHIAREKIISFGEIKEQIFRHDLDCSNPPETAMIGSDQAAYIMFTSGSTGSPKGAVIKHESVLNFLRWSIGLFEFEDGDVLTNLNPLFFDNSVFDIYSSLFSGAALVPFTKEQVSNPKKLFELLKKSKCNTWFSVPSLLLYLDTLRAFNSLLVPDIKNIVFGGEGFPLPRLKKLYDKMPNTSFYNVYGPTECTCICSCHLIGDEDFCSLEGFPPLGELIPSFSYRILGDDGKILPDFARGELLLIGPNVGLGYINDPDRTNLSFLPASSNQSSDEAAYRTGDIVSKDRETGLLRIHGRKDNQIKHLGYRIELEEIETAIYQISGVKEVVVLQRLVKDVSNLVAVVVLTQSSKLSLIKNELRSILPKYMQPTEFVVMDLPKNTNGKIDRSRVRELISVEEKK